MSLWVKNLNVHISDLNNNNMDNSFENILFLTSFCCMACDGDIAAEELDQLNSFSKKEKFFNTININDEFNRCLTILNEFGDDFIRSYFQAIETIDFTEKEKFCIIDVAVKTILADNKVEYSEIKFFRSIVSSLNIEKDLILENVSNIEDYWLEEDLSSGSDYKYFDNTEFSIHIPDNIDVQ